MPDSIFTWKCAQLKPRVSTCRMESSTPFALGFCRARRQSPLDAAHMEWQPKKR